MTDKERERTITGLFRDKTFRSFISIIRKYKRYYIGAIGSQVALTGLALLFAETSRRLFDLAPHVPAKALTVILGSFLLITLLRLGFTFIRTWLASALNESVVYEMRSNILNHIQHLPLSFHENNHSSNSINIMHNELEIAKNFVVSDVQKLITLPITILFVGIYLLTVHPLLGLIAIAIGPLQLLSNYVLKNKFKQAVQLQNQVTRDVFFTIGETLQGIREVKANQLEAKVDHQMKGLQRKGVDYNVLLTKVSSIRSIAREIPGQLGYISGVGLGALMMASGEIGPGGLVAFITLLDKVAEPFTVMVEVINNLQRAIAGARRLYDVMAMPIEDKSTGIQLSSVPPSIRFKDVCFEYTAGQSTLNHIQMDIPSGSSIALVGPSGAGKSTVIKLLYRFYDPQQGTIEINGTPITQYSISSLRANMALVSQDIFLFDGTVAENIEVGRPGASMEEIRRAAVLAQACEFIDALPNGFQSEIGERGIKLSHGQKQRISIARSILRNASILILDEPTSSLDVETEASFQRNLGEWASECTKIIIAHRLSTIREADYIVFIDSGVVMEHGTPEQLLRMNGRFRKYWDNHNFAWMPA